MTIRASFAKPCGTIGKKNIGRSNLNISCQNARSRSVFAWPGERS